MDVTIVDSCLRDGRGGSPTAVLRDGAFTDRDRRGLSERAGTSHAVFVTDGDPVSLRFFTAEGELPECGHGTLAAIAYLGREGPLRLRTVGRSFGGEAAGSMAWFEPAPVEVRDPTEEERALARDVFGAEPGIRAASIGRTRLLVPVKSAAALAALRPDQDRLRAACGRLGLLGCYVHSPPTAEGRVAARMFAPAIGVPEDIANANSTACLAAHHGTIVADMGDHAGRPSTVIATARGGRLWVGGEVRPPRRRG